MTGHDDKRASRLAGWTVVFIVHASAVVLYQLSQKRVGKVADATFLHVFSVVPVKPAKPPVAESRRPLATLPRAAARAAVERRTQAEPVQALETPAPAAVNPFAEPAADLGSKSKALARRHDREERKGKLAPLDVPNTPFARMKAAMEGAHVGGSTTHRSYTSLDGVVITRITRGGASTCLMGGALGGPPRRVNCPPAGEDWRRQ